MYGPNTPTEEPEEMQPEWYEPFPEPNTFPSGWNFSAFGADAASATGMDADEAAED